MLKTLFGAVLAGALGIAGAASAQTFPTRPMTLVIPFAAGGPTDVLGRVMAEAMSKSLGQQVVVENVGGAGGGTGSQRVARAAPDGYTLLLGTVGTHAQNQTLYKKPLYNAATDFQPVGLIAEVPLILITRKDFPASSFEEFVAYSKANQDKMTYGSAGAGSATHLGCVLLDFGDGHEDPARALPRHRPGDAGPPGRADRLFVRDRLDGAAADPGRRRQGHRDDDQGALAGAAGARHHP